MMDRIKLFIKKDYMKSFFICFIIAFLSFLPFVIKGEGFFVLTNDFNDQQIPFTIGLHNALLDSGISGFSWDIDLGTSTMDGFSFYELGSPFFWLSMLFPANAFPYIVAWLFMLKFSFAGLISCLYLRRFVKDSKWAILGSVLYAFSGFSLVNLVFYHFHDAICFFPLLLIGLERLKEKKDYPFFIFTVFLNCIINYFFFVGEVVFLVIYYLCRFGRKDIKGMLVDAVKCVLCGILGVGMAAFVFIPNIIFISGNPRTGQFGGILSMLRTSLPEYMYILKTLLLPADPMTSISAVYTTRFSSHGFYLPMIGLVLVIAYVVRKKDWLSKLIVYLAVASFIPLLSDLFYMYSAAQMRWWYMFTLMAALASVRMLEEPDVKSIKLGTGIYISLIAAFVIVINVLNRLNVQGLDWISNPKRFYTYVVLTVIGALVTCRIATGEQIKWKAVTFNVTIFALGIMFATMFVYKTCDWMGYQAYKQRYQVATQLELPSNQYRLNDTMNLISMTAHVAGFTNQSSTDTNSIRDFEALFDYYAEVVGMPKNDVPGVAELLAGKYYFAFEQVPGLCVAEYDTDMGKVYLMEREACPIGFAVDSYITKDDLMSMDLNQRGIALLDSAVLDADSLTKEIKADLPRCAPADIDLDKSISDYVNEHLDGAVLGFNKDGHGMSCVTAYDKDTYVYFSVPYDAGWSAYADDKQLDIIESGGMMMVKVPAGEHTVRFDYYTPGLKVGLVISGICILIFLVFTFYKQNGKMK
ncbi:membrane protein YfhO [Pseudobutyrivibrio sp. OR37]|nr:membrane protein YfhO [Pseudobutyrivibrio sp. OR37]